MRATPLFCIATGLLGATGGVAAAEREVALWTTPPRAKKSTVLSLPDLADRARPAVVHVRGTNEGPGAGDSSPDASRPSIGTGFLIHKDGYLVTNEHVIRAVSDLRIRLYDGRELP